MVLSCSSFSIIFCSTCGYSENLKLPLCISPHSPLQICVWKQTFSPGKIRYIDYHLIDISVLSANPKFACTGERIIKKTPRIWAGGNSTRLFTNPPTALPLPFTSSQPKQKHSRPKSRQLRRLRSTKCILWISGDIYWMPSQVVHSGCLYTPLALKGFKYGEASLEIWKRKSVFKHEKGWENSRQSCKCET